MGRILTQSWYAVSWEAPTRVVLFLGILAIACAAGRRSGDAAYIGVIPAAQYKAIPKSARQTNHIERINNTLRQRVSRLVCSTLAFSKTMENHIGAIRYFICHYNLTRVALLV